MTPTSDLDIRIGMDDKVTSVLQQMQLDEQERQFWQDAKRWQAEGSGMTREQKTGASMVWSWLSAQIGRVEESQR